MPRIRSDPGLDLIPDHAGPDYDIVRAALTIQTVADNDAAVAHLDDAWEATNARRKALWTVQEQQETAAAQLELDQARQQIADEEEAIKADVEAKRPKMIPVDFSRQIGDNIIKRPSSYALNLVKKNLYCPLWYFSDTALNEAAQIASQDTAEDVFGLQRTDAGLVAKSISASSPSPNAVLDKNLDWREFSLAQDGFLQQIAIARWSEDRIKTTKKFFKALNKHPMRHLPGGKGDRILLHYQAAARRQWHDDNDYGTCWDLASINETLLANFKSQIHDDTEDTKSSSVSTP